MTDFRFKPRHYLHFDLPVSRRRAEAIACDPTAVARRQFLPFIGYTIVTRRIRRDEKGQIERRPKTREIRIASHADAAIYSHYADKLSPLYEAEVDRLGLGDAVTAFRKRPGGGNNVDFAGEVFHHIDAHRPCVALAFDLEKFFDTLDHGQLKERWCRVLGLGRLPADHFSIFKSLTDFCWVERLAVFSEFSISRHNPKANDRRRICSAAEFRERVRGKGLLRFNPSPGKGIPQGSPISALLSNVYMLDADSRIQTAIEGLGGLYRRYCDDIMVVVPQEHQCRAEDVVRNEIDTAALTMNSDKTNRVRFPSGRRQPASTPPPDSGFSNTLQYLGFTYNGSRTLIRPGSLGRYYGKMRAGVSLAKQTQRKHNKKERIAGQPQSELKTRKLYLQYSYLIGRRPRLSGNGDRRPGNFLSYAYNASRKLRAPEIKRQVRRHWSKLQEEIRG